MRVRQLPGIRLVLDSGPDDRLFDGLLLLGPAVILLAAVLGRTVVTIGIAAAYIATLVGYILYRGLT